jgi:hypothetical protein
MKKRKIALAILFCFIAFAGVASAYVHSTIAKYKNAAPCGKLRGIPGILQASHFIAVGNCAVNVQTGGCRDRSTCTVTTFVPNPNPTIPGLIAVEVVGTCTTTTAGGTQCTCVPR